MQSYHTGKQLGEWGLIYACERGTNQSKHSRCLIHCFRHMGLELKSLSIVTPISFASLVVSSVVSFMQYSQPGFVVPRCSILHLSLLNPICHLWDQVRRLFNSELWFDHQGMIILGTAWCHPQIFLRKAYTPARQVSHWCIWQTALGMPLSISAHVERNRY